MSANVVSIKGWRRILSAIICTAGGWDLPTIFPLVNGIQLPVTDSKKSYTAGREGGEDFITGIVHFLFL